MLHDAFGRINYAFNFRNLILTASHLFDEKPVTFELYKIEHTPDQDIAPFFKIESDLKYFHKQTRSAYFL